MTIARTASARLLLALFRRSKNCSCTCFIVAYSQRRRRLAQRNEVDGKLQFLAVTGTRPSIFIGNVRLRLYSQVHYADERVPVFERGNELPKVMKIGAKRNAKADQLVRKLGQGLQFQRRF